jgi:hypothetical protein
MELLINILSIIAILYGIVLVFSGGIGSLMAGLVCVFAGVTAYDQISFIPLLIGFACLWILKLLGFEKR